MTLTETRYEHVVLDDTGTARIAGTRLKVIDLVEAKAANDWTTEQLAEQHPELTPGAVYSALAYYWDHKEALDAAIAERQQVVEELRRQSPPSSLAERLRRDGHR